MITRKRFADRFDDDSAAASSAPAKTAQPVEGTLARPYNRVVPSRSSRSVGPLTVAKEVPASEAPTHRSGLSDRVRTLPSSVVIRNSSWRAPARFEASPVPIPASGKIAATAPCCAPTGLATTADILPVTGSRNGPAVTGPRSAAGNHAAVPYTVPSGCAWDEHWMVPSWLRTSTGPVPKVRLHDPAGAARRART